MRVTDRNNDLCKLKKKPRSCHNVPSVQQDATVVCQLRGNFHLIVPVPLPYRSAPLRRTKSTLPHRMSISILNKADDKDFPNVSLRNDRDAPPFSAPCSTKLSASMLGTSKRSTFPVMMPVKCARTSSAVTSRAKRS